MCDSIIGTDANFWSTLKLLFEGSLLAESPFIACVEGSNHGTVGLLFVYGFMLVSVVLLLNMIIAMMGKTFDRHWETAQEQAAGQFASIVQDWEAQKDMPAPFNILALPYLILKAFASPFIACCERPSSTARVYTSLDESKGDLASDEDKVLRIITLKDAPGGLADLEELKDMIADNLNEKYGQFEDTGTLIDNAVKTLNDKMEEMEHMLMDIKMSTAAAAARAPGPK